MKSKGRHSTLVDYLTTRAWALEERILLRLNEFVSRHVEGVKPSQEEIDEIVAARDQKREGKPSAYEVRNGSAIIPISGVIAKYSSQVNGMSQPRGTSTQTVGAMIGEALADATVERIVMVFDSPGGSVDGVQALADTVFAARGKKPIVALADSQMCSAAYWIGSQADRIYSTPDASIGSIGVYCAFADYSRSAKNDGIEVHVVRSAPLKGTGVPGAPITSEQIAAIQREIDAYFELFVGAVARGRGKSESAILKVATGETWVGKNAVALGLADGIASLDSLLGAAASGQIAATGKNTAIGEAEAESQPTSEECQKPGGKSAGGDSFTTSGENEMNAQKDGQMTVARLEAEHPDLVKAVRDTALSEGHKKGFEEGVKQGTEAERQRASRILKRSTGSQRELACKLISEGTDSDAATDQLLDDPRRDASSKKQALEAASPPAVPPTGQAKGEASADDTKLRAQFDASESLRAEFKNDFEAFKTWKAGVAAGQIRRGGDL